MDVGLPFSFTVALLPLRVSQFAFLAKYNYTDQVKEDERGSSCSTGEEKTAGLV
jgi:hypothetical protein